MKFIVLNYDRLSMEDQEEIMNLISGITTSWRIDEDET